MGNGVVSPPGASTFLSDQKGTKESPGVGVRKTFGYASVFSATIPPDPIYGSAREGAWQLNPARVEI